MPLQPLQRGDDQMMRGRARAVAPVVIVNFCRAVEAETDEELVLGKETRPVLVNQRAVGLERVLDFAAGAIALLQFERAPVERDAEQRGLAALPGEQYRLPGGRRGDGLSHIGLEHLVRHAAGGAGVVERFLLKVEAIGTIEVAGRATGLGHQVKARSSILGHCVMPCRYGKCDARPLE